MQNVQFLSDAEYQMCDTYGDPIQMAILGVTPNMSKIIEKCARVCYRSEGKLSPDSHKAILRKLSRSGHYSTFEHSNIVIAIDGYSNTSIADNILEVLSYFPAMSVVPFYDYGMYVIRCNARTIVEMYEASMSNEWRGVMLMNNPVYAVMLQLRKQLPVEMFDKFVLDPVWKKEEELDREYINNQPNVEVIHIDNFPWQNSIKKPFAEKLSVATLIVDMNRQISHQFVRHRMSSYSQESQRYVDLSDKFDYMPADVSILDKMVSVYIEDKLGFPPTIALKYDDIMNFEHRCYKALRDCGVKPEVARGVLPNDCKTRIAVTRTIEQWRHYFNLRIEKHAQSLHQELAKNMLKAIQKNSYWLADLKGE